MSSLDVIVVNWNSGAQLRECLASLVASRFAAVRLGSVVVVDNASTDESLLGIQDFGLPLNCIENDANLGFGAACNQGAASCKSDYLLFLNPDARLFPDTIERSGAFMVDHPRAAVCGVALRGADGLVQRSCCRIPTASDFVVKALGLEQIAGGHFRSYVMTEWPHDEDRLVGHVIGAYYLMRRSAFEVLGGFDERFFVYFEDLDLSARIAATEQECWYLGSVSAFHKGGGTSEKIKAARLFYSLRSRLQYASKHFRLSGCLAVWLATLGIEPFLRLVASVAHRSGADAVHTVRGYGSLAAWAFRKTLGALSSASRG